MRAHSFAAILLTLPAALAVAVSPRALQPASSSLPSGWSYSGCYVDSVQNRQLNLLFNDSPSQTGEACIDFCGAKGYTVAGTEYSGECYCGLTLPFQYSFSGCDMPCAGLSTEVCGGSNHLTVYMKAQSANANSVPPGWYSRGCYMDSVNSRLLKTLVAVPGGSDAMTVALCTSTCGSFGYPLAGLEYAGECYCDTALGFAASMRPLGDCDMPCKGKLTEFCGGPNRLNLYQRSAI